MSVASRATADLRELLVRSGVRFTVQRLEMARLLLEKPTHMTAEQVFLRLNRTVPRASRATVFNNLKLFVEKGLLRTLEVQPGVTLYDSNTASHQHAVDRKSGTIMDLDLSPALLEKVRAELLERFVSKTGQFLGNEELQVVIRGDFRAP